MKAALLAALMTAAASASAGEKALVVPVAIAAPRLALAPATLPPQLPPARAVSLPSLPSALPVARAAAARPEAAPAAPPAQTTFGALRAAAAPAKEREGAGAAAQSARLAARFDGSAETPGTTVRSLRGGVYEAASADSRVSARLAGGVLSVEAGGPAARAELDHALAVFGRGVRAIAAAADAERSIAPWAADAGFSTAIRAPHAPEGRVLFARADDVLHDRVGAPWRRAASRMHVGAAWERYDNGGRSVWISRRVSVVKGSSPAVAEVIVAEYHGEAIPKAGTPADALAVFSSRGGVVSSFVDVSRAALLDPAAEQVRASSVLTADEKFITR